MTIQRKELLESLKQCMPGIETGSAVLQGADSFVFHDGKISTYNDSISVTVPIKSNDLLEQNLEGCVKAEEFFKIISKFASDEIQFTVVENGTWILKCGKAKAEMALLNFDYKTRLNNIAPEEDNWIELKDDFVAGVESCKMSTNKTQLAGIYFEGKDIISTDGNQANCYLLKDTEIPKFWISDNSIGELLKMKKLVAMQVQNTWVHFKDDEGTLFSIKTLNTDSYPYEKIKKIIDTSNPEKAQIHAKFPKDLFSAIDRAVSFSMTISEVQAVRIVISNEKIEVSAERSAGKYNEKVAWEEKPENNFEPITIYVDALVMQFIAQKTSEFYLLQGSYTPRLLFVTDSSKHLICTLNGRTE